MHKNGMGRTIKVVSGLPPLYSYTDLDGCYVLFTFKMIITSLVHSNIRRYAIKFNEGISLYWEFVIQTFHDKSITEGLTGVN